MKKFLFTIIALALGVAQMNAQSLSVDNFDIPEKGQAKVAFKYETGGKTIVQYGFNIVLPEGLSWVMDTDVDTNPAVTFEDGKGFNLNYLDGNFSFLPSSPSNQVKGTEGTLIVLMLNADETAKQGDVFTIKVTDVLFSEKDSEGNLLDVPLDDFEFDVTVVEDRVVFDETATSLPLFTAGQKKNIRMARTLKEGKWGTIVLPFDLSPANAKKAFGDDVQIAEFTGLKTTVDEETLTPTAMQIKFTTNSTYSALKPIAGGTPLLIKPSTDVASFDLDNVKLVDAVKDVTFADDEYSEVISAKMVGTFVKTFVPVDGLFVNSEKFYYSTGKTNIKAFRAWFESNAVIDKELDLGSKIIFVVDEEATDIDGIPSYQRITEGVYDLSGRKIKLEDGDLNKLQKGVYIIDGKKVTIK